MKLSEMETFEQFLQLCPVGRHRLTMIMKLKFASPGELDTAQTILGEILIHETYSPAVHAAIDYSNDMQALLNRATDPNHTSIRRAASIRLRLLGKNLEVLYENIENDQIHILLEISLEQIDRKHAEMLLLRTLDDRVRLLLQGVTRRAPDLSFILTTGNHDDCDGYICETQVGLVKQVKDPRTLYDIIKVSICYYARIEAAEMLSDQSLAKKLVYDRHIIYGAKKILLKLITENEEALINQLISLREAPRNLQARAQVFLTKKETCEFKYNSDESYIQDAVKKITNIDSKLKIIAEAQHRDVIRNMFWKGCPKAVLIGFCSDNSDFLTAGSAIACLEGDEPEIVERIFELQEYSSIRKGLNSQNMIRHTLINKISNVEILNSIIRQTDDYSLIADIKEQILSLENTEREGFGDN